MSSSVERLLREREHLFLLHEALIAAERVEGLEAKIGVFVEAIAKLGYERVVVALRNADLDQTHVVTTGLTVAEEEDLRLAPAPGSVWRRLLPQLERFRISQSFYLDGRDDWVAREFGGGLPSRLAGGDDPRWSPKDALLVLLKGGDGAILGTLVVDDPSDRARPTLARVRIVELFGQQVAYCIQQKRLAALAGERAGKLQRLQEVGGLLTRSLDEREIIRELARQVTRIVSCDGVVITHPDVETGMVSTAIRVVRGVERVRPTQPIGTGPVAEVTRTGRPVRVDCYDPERVPLAYADDVVGDGGPAGSVLAVPMMQGTRLLGVLAVHAAPPHAFSEEDEEVLVTIASQAATAIANARLYAESQGERRHSEALADIARAVGESLRLDDVLRIILRHATALLRTEGACVALEQRPETLSVVAGEGSGELLVGMELPVGESLSGRAMREGTYKIINDTLEDPLAYTATRDRAAIDKTIIVPLITGRGAIGVLSVLNRNADFTDADARVLQRLADHVAVAIVNARLFGVVARHKLVIETSNDAIVITDRDRRIAFANPASGELFGRDGSLVGTPVSELVPPEHWPDVEEREAKAFAGQSQRYETVVVRPDGERRIVSVSAAPLTEAGEVTGVVASLRDVSEERRRAEALARSEAGYSRLVESASDAIFTVDQEGAFTSVNRALEQSVGRDRADLYGRRFIDVLDPRDRESTWQAFLRTMQGERTRMDFRYLHASGDVRHGSIITTPIVEEDRVTGALGVVRDTTDERRLMEQLLQQEKLAAIGQLVSGVAHELNNPLAGVMAFSQLLLASGSASADQESALETIHAEAKRAAKIVANLLTFARQHPPERRAADLNQVLLDTLELRRYTMRVQQIEVDVVLDPALPVTWGDQFQLQQVFLNLITNAEQAFNGWEGEKRITIRSRREGDALIISVTDSGPGIDAGTVDQIFNPFFTTKPVGQGTGLGLSISDGIVREHGGRIRVSSRSGEGATFTVELPWVPATDGQGGLRGQAKPAAQPRSVLIVDDEPSIRRALSGFLTSAGHAVEAVGTSAEALALLRRRRFDAVLLDLRMPDIPGDAVYAEVQSRDPEQASRIVFVTGDVQSESAQAFIRASGRPCLSKPFMLEEVASLLFAGFAS